MADQINKDEALNNRIGATTGALHAALAATPAVPAPALTDERINEIWVALAYKGLLSERIVYFARAIERQAQVHRAPVVKLTPERVMELYDEAIGKGGSADNIILNTAWAIEREVLASQSVPAPDALAESDALPIQMILHCPKCSLQHIDAPEPRYADNGEDDTTWHNPPHRSHLCHNCSHIWRPADVATEGVRAIETRGKADSPIASQPQATPLEARNDDEPTDREQLIACLGDDAAKLADANPDCEMAQTMREAAAMLEADEQMGGAQVATPKVLGVSRDAESPGGKGVLVAFERALTDDELRHFHDSLATPRATEGAATSERKPLTKVEVAILAGRHVIHAPGGQTFNCISFAKAIEQHHGIGSAKNG